MANATVAENSLIGGIAEVLGTTVFSSGDSSGVAGKSATRLTDQLHSIWTHKPPIEELAAMEKASVPATADLALDRLKKNGRRNVFWYAALVAMLDLLYIFFNKWALIPVLLTAGFVWQRRWLLEKGVSDIKQVGACLLAHLLVCLASKTMAATYTHLLAMHGVGVLLVIIHGMVLEPVVDSADV